MAITLSSPTLARLIKEARVFLRQQDNGNSTWSDEELGMYLNDAVRAYFVEMCEQAEGQFDASSSPDLDIVANVETIALPTDCHEVRAVYRKQGDQWIIMPYRPGLIESYNTQGADSYYIPYYFIRGNSLVIRPTPTFNETGGIHLEYTAFPETMIWGGDTLTSKISPIFKELVVMYAVYKARLSESSVDGGATYIPAEKHLSDLYQQFQRAVGYRSKYPQSIKPFNP